MRQTPQAMRELHTFSGAEMIRIETVRNSKNNKKQRWLLRRLCFFDFALFVCLSIAAGKDMAEGILLEWHFVKTKNECS